MSIRVATTNSQPTISIPSGAWRSAEINYTGMILAWLYMSRFVPDVMLAAGVLLFLCAGEVMIRRRGVMWVCAAAVLISLQMLLLGGHVEHPLQPIHMLFVLSIALMFDDRSFSPSVLVSFARFTTVLNISLLVAALIVPSIRDIVLWGSDRGLPRFMSVLPEPSFVGLYSVFNFFVLLRSGRTRLAYANLLPLVASASFAGLAALALFAPFAVRFAWKHLLAMVAILGVAAGAIAQTNRDLFEALFVGRVTAVMSGVVEESVALRLFAPMDLVRYTYGGEGSRALTGLGLGNVEHVIQKEQSELKMHWRADGVRSTEPDNVIAFVASAFGVAGLAFIVTGIATLFLRRVRLPEYALIVPMILAICLLTGLFISIHLWVWPYLLRQERLFSENPATGSATAVST